MNLPLFKVASTQAHLQLSLATTSLPVTQSKLVLCISTFSIIVTQEADSSAAASSKGVELSYEDRKKMASD